MRIEPNLYLVGSGNMGFNLTDAFDCNVYLFDSGDGYVLFDAGTGMGVEQIWAVCRQEGLDPARIAHLFLTHAHGDHGGGAAHVRDRTEVTVYAGVDTARIVTAGNEEAVSLPAARAAGVYPPTYVYRACTVDRILADGEKVTVGDLTVMLIATPGHSHDHVSYLVQLGERRYLIAGDAIFHGGRIVLQNTYDCSVPQSTASIQRLATYDFAALLPGHLTFSLHDGKRHIETACAIIDTLGCPPALT
jgi:glyoxylase-like metal-dependent hydrolase (beta-lactamase superfamily II)